ncbi:transcription factor IIA, alpha/beta subunit [Plenodomus tracheiphilus IPT5]|uniref:Transcription factor IIA, alpha/beta subunit n=1 Tax=Plenodomus tracheiphilus IPT5 TaxID=1408161 RepID=A0A6A7BDX8_9PLEO|nr:transcription factor IIA, alpha/beta subunit [Plenodomus tracheiphilus IPT5]
MSNQVVGAVYQQIIDKVITVSTNDFEEFGVDHSTLDELKQGWQEKLSGLKVAQFPWDPQPEPVRQPPTVPSNVKADVDVPVSASQEPLNFPNVPMKSEGGYAPPITNYPTQAQTADGSGYNGGYAQNTQLAQQRAAALVHARVLQQGHPQQQNYAQQQHMPQMPMQGQQGQQQQRMMSQHQPPHPQPHPQHQQQQQRPQQQQLPPQQRPTQQGHVYTSQTDGSGDALADWEALKAARAASIEEQIAADQFMRARVDAMAMRQDSGLMVPIDSMPKGRKRKAAVRMLQSQDAEASSSAPVPARFDGDDDVKEEDPDDAINSDLDDPEDDLNDGDNSDDDMVDYMLCTYDKVQRVKNKWKCTLKDGILTTNKKEYLFHKANGEFEW